MQRLRLGFRQEEGRLQLPEEELECGHFHLFSRPGSQSNHAATAIVTCIGKTSAGFDLGLSIAAGVDLKLPQLVTFERGHFNDYKAHWQKSCAVYAGIFGQTSGRYSCSQLTSSQSLHIFCKALHAS